MLLTSIWHVFIGKLEYTQQRCYCIDKRRCWNSGNVDVTRQKAFILTCLKQVEQLLETYQNTLKYHQQGQLELAKERYKKLASHALVNEEPKPVNIQMPKRFWWQHSIKLPSPFFIETKYCGQCRPSRGIAPFYTSIPRV